MGAPMGSETFGSMMGLVKRRKELERILNGREPVSRSAAENMIAEIEETYTGVKRLAGEQRDIDSEQSHRIRRRA
jgi:hypothetical protein